MLLWCGSRVQWQSTCPEHMSPWVQSAADLRSTASSGMILEEEAWQLDFQVYIHIVSPKVFYKSVVIIEVQFSWLRNKKSVITSTNRKVFIPAGC